MKTKSDKFTEQQLAELKHLKSLPDDQINVEEIPEMLDWSNARQGLFYKPVKQQITIRLDTDVIHWFKMLVKGSRGYQTEINQALRDHIKRQIAESK